MTDRSPGKILIAAGIIVVVAAVIGGMFLIGPPSEQRQLRLDERRVRDLRAIQTAVNSYYLLHHQLPKNLEQLKGYKGSSRAFATDPETGDPYSFRITGSETFELCAVFKRKSEEEPYAHMGISGWKHGVGKQCFELRATTSGTH